MIPAFLSLLASYAEAAATLLPSAAFVVYPERHADAAGRNVTLPVPPVEGCAIFLIRDVWKGNTL